jgi:hypothetical protein
VTERTQEQADHDAEYADEVREWRRDRARADWQGPPSEMEPDDEDEDEKDDDD